MHRLLTKHFHTALKFEQNSTANQDAVVLLKKGKNPPRWASVSKSALADFNNLKSLWTYPKTNYSRCLLQEIDPNDLFSSACNSIEELQNLKIENADIIFPDQLKPDQLELWANTAILKNYKYSFKTQPDEENPEKPEVKALNLIHKLNIDQESWNQNIHSAVCAIYARDLCNTRGSEATPEYMASQAEELYSKNSSKIALKILKGEELKNSGLNLLYSVGKGSISPPHLVLLKYTGNPKSSEKISFVGKGLTFDTGGLNLKPTKYIEDMYTDKAGACAALASFKWAVEMEIPVNLTCTLALAENSIGSKVYKPLDIIKSLKGITVEVGNTDAEGRLCLADALTYTQREEKPEYLIDLATLTGSCVVALGEKTAGIFGNNAELVKKLIGTGKYYNELMWELPILDEHKKGIEGEAADITNSGKSRYADASAVQRFCKSL